MKREEQLIKCLCGGSIFRNYFEIGLFFQYILSISLSKNLADLSHDKISKYHFGVVWTNIYAWTRGPLMKSLYSWRRAATTTLELKWYWWWFSSILLTEKYNMFPLVVVSLAFIRTQTHFVSGLFGIGEGMRPSSFMLCTACQSNWINSSDCVYILVWIWFQCTVYVCSTFIGEKCVYISLQKEQVALVWGN